MAENPLVPGSGHRFVICPVKQQLPGPQRGKGCSPPPALVPCAGKRAVPGARPGREALASAEQAPSKSLLILSHHGAAGGESAFQNVSNYRWSGVQGFAVQGFLVDVHPECLFVVPRWPPVRDGGS